MKIDEQQLRELLGRAYEAGWHGCKELRDTAVEEIIEDFNQRPKQAVGWKVDHLIHSPQMVTLEQNDHGWIVSERFSEEMNNTYFNNNNNNSYFNFSLGVDGGVDEETADEVIVV